MSITRLHKFIQSRLDMDGSTMASLAGPQSNFVHLHSRQSANVVPRQELLNLERLIRETAQTSLISRKQPTVSFKIEVGNDIPDVTGFRADWDVLVVGLLNIPAPFKELESEYVADNIRFELQREARAVRLSFNRFCSGADMGLDAEDLALKAKRVGKLLELNTSKKHVHLAVHVPINSGIVAPELKHSEERIRRVHNHANGNGFSSQNSNIKKTG